MAGLTSDMIASGNMTCPSPQYSVDRFGNANGAISVRSTASTVWSVPAGVYFTGDFTFIVWFKPYGFGYFDFIFDFSSAAVNSLLWSNNVNLHVNQGSYPTSPLVDIHVGATQYAATTTTFVFQANLWYHVAAKLSGTSVTIYVNGVSVGTSSGGYTTPVNATRITNNIGGSLSANQGYSNADYDEIRIYNRGLTDAEVLADYAMNQSLFYQI
jgi:hypothetical protein